MATTSEVCFLLACGFIFGYCFCNYSGTVTTPNAKPTEPAARLVTQLSSFRESNTLSDFEVTCQGRTWKVHRLVLGLHSSVFLRACDGKFREAQEHRLDLSAHDSEVIDCLIAYMYTLDYPKNDSVTWIDVQLCILADMYDISPLKELCVKNFKIRADRWRVSFSTEDHASAIKLIGLAYSAHDATKNICEVIVEKFVERRIMADPVSAGKYREAITDYPEFAMDVMKAGSKMVSDERASVERIGDRSQGKGYMCPSCRTVNTIDLSATMRGPYFSCFRCRGAFTKEQWALWGVY